MPKLILISKYALNKESGHSLVDEEYYFAFLVRMGVEFDLYTSSYSAKILAINYPDHEGGIFILDGSNIKYGFGDKLVFLGFSEVNVIQFMLKFIAMRPKFILLATNNFSIGRVLKYRFFLRIFLFVVNGSLERLVLHTEFERKLVVQLSSKIASKIFIKKHHLMMRKSVIDAREVVPDNIVSFYGPVKRDKPIDSFLQLVQSDKDMKFIYHIYHVDVDFLNQKFPQLSERSNVRVINDWFDFVIYLQTVKKSTLVFLGHSDQFEGKLSGNLCDCVALGVPYIAHRMEPMMNYHDVWGDLGFLVDFNDPFWADVFLLNYSVGKLASMRENLNNMGQEYSQSDIDDDLAACLIE